MGMVVCLMVAPETTDFLLYAAISFERFMFD